MIIRRLRIFPRSFSVVQSTLLFVIFFLNACVLEQFSAPDQESLVVVTAVMRPDFSYQYVIVEETLTGVEEVSDSAAIYPVPPFRPHVPILGATVTVSNLDLPGDTCGNPALFRNTPYDSNTASVPGIYWAPENCPTMRPGDRLELIVETIEGKIVTGTTVLPGMNDAFLTMGGNSIVMGGGDSILTFNRNHDTLRFQIDPIVGRLVRLDVRRNGDLTDFGAKLQVDTTDFIVPGNAVDIFFSGTGQEIFRGGRSYILNLALADTNFFDFSRSANNEFTGRGFINHLSGGIGVFGSAVSVSNRVWVTADFDDPREGLYHVTGQLDGATVDAELRVYVQNGTEETEVSAFLEGDWFTEGSFSPWAPKAVAGQSVDGEFVAGWLHLLVSDTLPDSKFVFESTLDGYVSTSDSVLLVLSYMGINGAIPFDTLIAVRQPEP